MTSFQKFMDAIRNTAFGVIFSVGSFDEALWTDFWNRLFFYCTTEGLCECLRPAENMGLQFGYLEEILAKKGSWNEDDYEEVYPDYVLDGQGKKKEKPVHIYVPDMMKKIKVSCTPFEPSGLEGFLEQLLPPYTHKNKDLQERQIVTLLSGATLRYYSFLIDQVALLRLYCNLIACL